MSDPLLPLQAWIVETIESDSPPPAPIFDKVPANNPFPRITIGPGQSLPGEDDGECASTWELFQQVDVWAREGGYVACKTIAGQIKALIHNAVPALTGYRVVLLEWRGTDYMRDPDGLTSRARMQFRALIDEADPEP
jgi:hypothetical protein